MPSGFSITYVDQQESLIADLRQLVNKEKARAERAEAALAALQTPCVCRRADDGWIEPGCGGPITTTRTYPFCMHCGHPQTVAEWSREAQP